MSELIHSIKAHFIHEERGLHYGRVIAFAPRVGDELRFADDKYFTVTRLVWVYDEPEARFSRLNIGITEAP
jgi:hypothetical protein